jgi:hypothetical protein
LYAVWRLEQYSSSYDTFEGLEIGDVIVLSELHVVVQSGIIAKCSVDPVDDIITAAADLQSGIRLGERTIAARTAETGDVMLLGLNKPL